MAERPKDGPEQLLEKNSKLCAAIKEKRAQIAALQDASAASAATQTQYIEMLGAASRCWDQLQLHLELALSRSGASIPEASLQDTDGNSFLVQLRDTWKKSAAVNCIDESLGARCEKLGQLALSLVESAERAKTSDAGAAASELDAAHAKIAQVSMELATNKERAEISEANLVTQEQECHEAAAQLLVANRSLQLLRVEHEQLKHRTPEKEPEVAAKSTSVEHAKPEEQKALKQSQAELVAVKAERDSRLALIEDLNTKLATCKNELKAHQMVQIETSPEEVHKHPDFINLNMKLQNVMRELSVTRDDKERLHWEKENLEATHSLQIQTTKVHSMEQQAKSDAAFEKLKQANSVLNAEVDALKRKIELKDVVPDLGPQLQEQQLLSKTLKDELERANKANVRQAGLLEVSEKQAQAAMNQNKDELVTQLNLKLEMKEKEIEEYLEEINEVAATYEDLRAQNVRLLDQLKSKEESKNQLVEEKIQAKRIESMLRAQKEELQRKATVIAEEKEASACVQARLEEQLKNAESQASNLMESEKLINKLVDSHKTFTNDAMVLYNGARAKLETKTKVLEALQQQHQTDIEKLRDTERECQVLNEKATGLTKKLGYLDKAGGGGKKSGAEKELVDLKSYLSCKIDPTKMLGLDKFCVITKCYHSFSESGLMHNLANRNRKCPACQLPFDRCDVKSLFIDF